MKSSRIAISLIIALGSIIVKAEEHIAKIKDLETIKINNDSIVTTFLNLNGIKLNSEDEIRVSADEEGENIKFETLDHLSIVVSIDSISGGFNKDISK